MERFQQNIYKYVNLNSLMNGCHVFFETLGTSLKIDILNSLRKSPSSVNEISENLGEERSKVSHALLSLLDCGFLEVKRDGKKRIYSLNKETTVPLLKLVDKHTKKYCKICKKNG